MEGITGIFKDAGGEVDSDAALARKDKLVKSASYLTMSKESSENLRDTTKILNFWIPNLNQ